MFESRRAVAEREMACSEYSEYSDDCFRNLDWYLLHARISKIMPEGCFTFFYNGVFPLRETN